MEKKTDESAMFRYGQERAFHELQMDQDSTSLADNTVMAADVPPTSIQVLHSSRRLLFFLSCGQTVFALAGTVMLSDSKVRTGWSQTFGATCACLCFIEGFAQVVTLIAKVSHRVPLVFPVLFSVVCYVAIISLITNTEDNAHGVAVDSIEAATCCFALGWGLMISRISARIVEKEALTDCTFELKFTQR